MFLSCCRCLQDTVITYFYPDGEIEVGTKYQGRASLDADVSKGKGDLKLSSITLADNKTFECTVLIPRDAQGITADSASLVVLGNKFFLQRKKYCSFLSECLRC